jgi:membrane AbrB-like protein
MTFVLAAGLVAGVLLALRRRRPVSVPQWMPDLGQAAVGAAAGASVDGDVIGTLAQRPLLTIGGVLATLMVTLVVGQLLRLGRGVSSQTATFSSIAGGAAGVSLMAQQYGADATTVLSVQYLRVLAVIASVPVVAPLLGDGTGGTSQSAASVGSTHVFAVTTIGFGLVLARVVPLPAGTMLIPMLVAAVIASTGRLPGASVPAWLLALAYLVVGFVAGSALTRDRLRDLSALFPLAVALTVLGIVVCAGIGLAFAATAHVSPLDGYLATTPGGLPAVTAVALQTGDNVGLILAMQSLRLFLAVLIAALVGAHFRRTGPP